MEQEQQTSQSNQQTSDKQDLRNMTKPLFEQMGTMRNLFTSVVTKVK
jgi:hypothetical protein